MSLQSAISSYSEDFEAMENYTDELYESMFAHDFSYVHALSDAMKNEYKPVSDDVLEQILIEVPLKLFDISESLNKLQMQIQVVKLKLKKLKIEKRKLVMENSPELTQSYVNELVQYETFDDELLVIALSRVTERVQSEISYTKELIMGAKKVWDRRKETESSMPVAPIDPSKDVPSYTPNFRDKNYIG